MNKYDSRYMKLQEEKLKSVIEKQATVTNVACELNVSRQTIHKWLLRYKRFGIDGLISKKAKRQGPAHNRTSEEVEILVEHVSHTYWQDGVETLHDRLQCEYNITLHPTTIYRILKRNDVRYTKNYQHTKKQWKKKLYAHQVPGKELQMDTKYPYGYKQGKVIYTIIDDATRWVFAWSYETANKINTLDFLEKVFARAPFDIQKIRTDQGREFIANDVKEFMRNHDVIFRNNTPYCPEENGKIERFHRTLNDKALRFGFIATEPLDTMQYKLNLFLHYYNYQKRHRGLGMEGKTPMQRLQECASVNLTLQCHNILQPVTLFIKIKSIGIRQYWKELKMKAFVLKTGAFFVAVAIIFPMWVGGYIGVAMFAEAKINIIEENINISGTGSMYPTFPKGDGKTNEERRKELVATPGSTRYPTGFALMGNNFFSYEIERGDIISFFNAKTREITERDGGTAGGFLKRVIALPGDNIEIRDGLFFLNGKPQKEQYIARARSTFGGEFLEECKPLEIPAGKIFVMGDNRKGSGDSRADLGLIDYLDVNHVIPLEKQYGNLDKNWRDTANDLDESSIITLDVNKYVDLLNEKRKESGLKPLKYQPKLEKSAKLRGDAILKYDDFSFEGTKSGYDMKKAMQDVGYSNVTYGEAPTQGYYEADELIENKFEFPDSKKFLLSKDYQEIGIATVKGELNGCPTQVIVQHFAGYVPPNYSQSDINSWRDTLASLKKNKPGWESLKKYDIYYEENKKNVDRINSIISTRISNIKRIISRMESNQWLTAEEQGLIDQDGALFNEQEKIADKLND